MLFAKKNDLKVEAKPNERGICSLCNAIVIAKCGDINVWHWAHLNTKNCDSWYEPETFWHKHWKMTFGMENTEIGIIKNDKKHIADVYTAEKIVIELQNSPISKSTIRAREEFYGEKMIWIINGEKFKDNFKIYEERNNKFLVWEREWDIEAGKNLRPIRANDLEFYWRNYRKSWSEVKQHVFIDFGAKYLFMVLEGMGTSRGFGKLISKKIFINKYGGDYTCYCQHGV